VFVCTGLTVSQRCHQSAIIIELLSPKTRGSCHGRVLTVCRHLKGEHESIPCLGNSLNEVFEAAK